MTFTPKVKKLLTRPVLKLELDVARYVKIVAAMYIGKEMKKKKGDDDKQKEPATIIDCIDLETGAECEIVANTVLKSVLAEEYPAKPTGAKNEDGTPVMGAPGYVGKCFSITKQAKQAGRDYNKFKIEEIEDPAADEKKDEKKEESAPVANIGGKKR